MVISAKTCDTDKVSITSITLKEKYGNVEEIKEATVNGKNIKLNLSMSDVGDNIKYEIIVKNDSDEDYEVDGNTFNLSSNYISYVISSDDNSNVIKANASKTMYLNVKYIREVPTEEFQSGEYNDNNTMMIGLSNQNINMLDDSKEIKIEDRSNIAKNDDIKKNKSSIMNNPNIFDAKYGCHYYNGG